MIHVRVIGFGRRSFRSPAGGDEKLQLTAERTVSELINRGGDLIDKMRKFLDNGAHDPFPY